MMVLWPRQIMAQDADAVFASVVENYRGGLSARFVYTMSSEVWSQDLVYSGQLLLFGDQYRIETDHELIIGLGSETQIYRPADNQMLISMTPEDELAFTPGNLFANYEQNFRAEEIWRDSSTSIPHNVIELTPRLENSPLRRVSLWVRQSDGIVTRIEAADLSDSQIAIEIENVVLGPDITPDTFSMPMPEGVEVIDLR